MQSPNFSNEREEIKFIVIHATELNFKDSIEILCDSERKNRVSAHYLIDRNGKLYNLVPENKTAWHAGISYWAGERNINKSSIGIELVCELGDDFTPQQYNTLIPLCKKIIRKYNIQPNNIVAHSDIAIARKTDPGTKFDWRLLTDNGIGILYSEIAKKKHITKEELKEIGYDVESHTIDKVIEAFKLHHSRT